MSKPPTIRVCARRIRFGARRCRGFGHGGLVDAEVAPAAGAFEGATDDVVDLAGGVAGQRAAGVAVAGAAAAHLAAALESGVEAFEQLGVELGGQDVAEGRQDVEPDQVVVALAGGVLQLGDVEPLLDGLPDGDVRLRLPVLVHLALEPGQRLLSLVVRLDGLPELPWLTGERVGTGVNHHAVRATRELADVPALAVLARRHGHDRKADSCHEPCHEVEPFTIPNSVGAGQRWCPRQDSNLRHPL
jgi:hypothetical protein